jgi:hypothetical protein
MFARWGNPEWRHEDGPGYELRQYRRGRPTGIVATTAWAEPPGAGREVLSGPDVWLVREPTRITIVERQDTGHGAVRLRIPLRSCQDITIVDEPGLPGAALVRLTVTVRLGARATVTVRLWLAGGCRPVLEDLARRIRVDEPASVLPRLEVAQAPDDDDWIVFRPSRSSEDVVVGRAL